jgi:hypothetical protein
MDADVPIDDLSLGAVSLLPMPGAAGALSLDDMVHASSFGDEAKQSCALT